MGSSESSNEEKKEENCTEELNKLIQDVDQSIKSDKSLPNLINNFSKLLPKPGIDCLVNVIKSMKKNWSNMDKYKQWITENFGEDEANDIMKIERNYWLLLLKTQSVVSILMKKCQIQQGNVHMLLDIMNESEQKNGELSDDDAKSHSFCLEKLVEWVNTEKLDELVIEWQKICDSLSEKQKTWEQKLEVLKNDAKNTAMSCLKWVGIILTTVAITVAVVFAVIAISTATMGAGTVPAVAAGAVAVKGVSVGSATFVATHAIGCGVAVSIAATGGLIIGGYKIWENCDVASKRYKMANNIMKMIQKMIKNSKNVQCEISSLNDETEKQKEELSYLKKKVPRRIMKESLKRIDKHLIEYIAQGQKVGKAVKSACKIYSK